MADPEKKPLGLRHLYTKADHGSLGSRGFQTVACARTLEKGRTLLENLAKEYRPAGDDGSPTRQVFPVPDGKHVLLTKFWPRSSEMRERKTNFWAESVLVPTTWLQEAEWDVDAAFEDLSRVFEGPEAAGRYQGWPCDLDPVALAPLKPGSLDRLDLIRTHLDDRALFDLVRALLSQREAQQPVFVVVRNDALERERLVFLLPLLLPPPLRVRAGEHKVLPLRLRDYGHVEHLPAADLQGLPAGLRPNRGLVVDLSGEGPRPDVPRDPRAEGYAEWVCETIRGSHWRQAFRELYEGAVRRPGKDPIAEKKPTGRARLAVDEEDAMKKRAEPSVKQKEERTASGAYEARSREWEERREAERALWTAEGRIEADMNQQLATLERGLEKIAERFSAQMAEQQKDLLAKLDNKANEMVQRVGTQAARRLGSAPRPVSGAGQGSPSGQQGAGRMWRYAAMLAVGLVLGYFAARFQMPGKPATASAAATEPRNASNDGVAPAKLPEAFRDGKTAAAVLARVIKDDGAAKDWAVAAGLALRLRQVALTEALSCSLVQTLLGTTVDGDCGPGTMSALEKKVTGTPCAGKTWPESGLCFLREELKLEAGKADCAASWPLRRTCGWDLRTAMNLLNVILAAERTTANAGLKANLAAYDLARNPKDLEGVAKRSLEEPEAAWILETAYVAALEASEPKGAGEMTEGDLQKIRDRFASELAGSGGS